VASIGDLRGKVVILDFWTTWCAPCVGSFDVLRALRKSLPHEQVVLLGVTAPQGRHDPSLGDPTIDTRGDPARELALMADYMDAHDITWTVACVAGSVFAPSYGVRSIPHMTIIDAEGLVRHTRINPTEVDPAQLEIWIRELLPAADPIARAIEAYKQQLASTTQPSEEQRRAAADAALAELDIETMGVDQLDRLLESNAAFESSRWVEVAARLAALAAEPSVAGARAAVLRLDVSVNVETQQDAEIIAAMLEHPKLAEALQDAELWPHFLNFAWWMEPAAVEGMQDALIALGQHIPERTPMLGVLGAADLFDIIASSDPAGYARREPLRLAVIAALERLAKYQDPHDPTLKRWNFARDIPGTISDRIARLSSGATRGTLLDGPAPRIDFIWNSSGAPLSSFEDLQGRIVVADFFTTWCGPCIASFPRVRDLVERYAAAPVEFLGITSLQGMHVGPDGRVDCADDSEKELALMDEFIERHGVTWTVAFSEQSANNPSFGIQGIPHVVILDAAGDVRVNGMHPTLDHDAIVGWIDTLLREMGHEPPIGPGADGGGRQGDQADAAPAGAHASDEDH
jgi:thiol-disulfide isomerase/thioredoxin